MIFIYVVLLRVRHIINLIIKIYYVYDRFFINRILYIKMRINDTYRRQSLFISFIFKLKLIVKNKSNLDFENLKIVINNLIIKSLIE